MVAEVRAGLVETAACECGAVETVFRTEPQADSCESRGVSKLVKHEERVVSDGRGKERRSAEVLSSCIGGSALQGTPVQEF